MACAQLLLESCDCGMEVELEGVFEPQALDLVEDMRRLLGVLFRDCVDGPAMLVRFRSGCAGPRWRRQWICYGRACVSARCVQLHLRNPGTRSRMIMLGRQAWHVFSCSSRR